MYAPGWWTTVAEVDCSGVELAFLGEGDADLIGVE